MRILIPKKLKKVVIYTRVKIPVGFTKSREHLGGFNGIQTHESEPAPKQVASHLSW